MQVELMWLPRLVIGVCVFVGVLRLQRCTAQAVAVAPVAGWGSFGAKEASSKSMPVAARLS